MLGEARDASARRGALGLAALVALAAVVRIVAWARSGAIFDDGPVFLYLAQALLDGDVGAVLRHPYHPGYPAAVAAVYASGVAPSLEVAGVAVSIAAGALAVALLFVFVRDTFDEGAAWIAAALLAWQLAAVGAAARDAEEQVRIEALRSTGSDAVITLTTSVPVDGPLASGLAARARARVVAP